PCGYVAPLIDMVFEGKKNCGGATVDLSKCYTVPEPGKPLVVKGVLEYYWKESEDLTYPSDPNAPVEISFAHSASDPKWLDFKVEPATFTIDQQGFLDPTNSKVDQSTSPPTVYFWFQRDITITFTRNADPTANEVQGISNHDGVQEVYVKAKSTDSGQYIKASFGGETFRFDASTFLGNSTASGTPASSSAKSS